MNNPTLKLLSAARSDEVLWQSKPMLIGKTYWILILYYSKIHKKIFTGYHFNDPNFKRYIPCDEWKKEKDHPNYKFNDGTYMGLPKTLVNLYNEHKKFLQKIKGKTKQEALLLIEEHNNIKTTLF